MRKGHLSGSLYRLIYYSRNPLAERMSLADLRTEIDVIVEQSQRRNVSEGVTGCLLCSASGFAQALEGTRDAVERTFDRISADPRHTDVMTISLRPIEKPSFPEYAMALAWHADPETPDPLRHLVTGTASDLPRAITGADMLRLLRAAVD
ncbi:MAG TPA: BLUF domain-containing protein [Rhodopila sp.]|nr:BLUF domain-containing protein [Rhodopila sp.]